MHADGLLNAIPDTEGNVDHFFAIGLEQSSMLVDTSSAATSVAAFLRGDLTGEDLGVDGTVDTEGLDIDAAPFPRSRRAGPRRWAAAPGTWWTARTTRRSRERSTG
jgi:sn-glycerol 3-phosphate transport system substrate-binding protein